MAEKKTAAKRTTKKNGIEEKVKADIGRSENTGENTADKTGDMYVEEKVYHEKKSARISAQTVDIPLNTLIEVKNGSAGRLIYASKRTPGYEQTWENYGDVAYIELSELVACRASQPNFFKKNWFIIEDEEVLRFLRVDHWYRKDFSIDYLESIFDADVAEMRDMVAGLTDAVRCSVREIAKRRIASGEIDSKKRIDILEDVLGCKFE